MTDRTPDDIEGLVELWADTPAPTEHTPPTLRVMRVIGSPWTMVEVAPEVWSLRCDDRPVSWPQRCDVGDAYRTLVEHYRRPAPWDLHPSARGDDLDLDITTEDPSPAMVAAGLVLIGLASVALWIGLAAIGRWAGLW